MITVVVGPEELRGETVEIRGDAYRHLFRARRAAVGDEIRLVDGAGNARAGAIESVGRAAATVRVGEVAEGNDPVARVELWVAPPKPERAAWLVEKASELGLFAVRFVATERAPRDYGPGQLERLRRVAVSGLEQSHGARLPEISGVHPWIECLATAAQCERRIVLDRGGAPFQAADAAERVAVLVGPEGGLGPSELATLGGQGWLSRSLGRRVLRVETAALTAASHLLS